MMSSRAHLLDTSYLAELYKVPGKSSELFYEKLKTRLKRAFETKDRLWVPFPVLFELGNHIAQVADGGARHRLASRLIKDVRATIEDGTEAPLWQIMTEGGRPALLLADDLHALIHEFSTESVPRKLGLTDTSIIRAARLLKSRLGSLCSVHIWTTDRELKSCEPDTESDPLMRIND